MSYARKVDDNQALIVQALRQVGAKVQPLHMVGKGCPDVLVGFRGMNYLLEIKDGQKPPSARRLTPAEHDWQIDWRGQVATITSVEEAYRVIGVAEPGAA